MSKILFLSTLESGTWGGSEQLWSDMAVALKELGHDVMTNTIEWKDTPQRLLELKDKGIQLTFRPNPHTTTSFRAAAQNKLKAYKWKNRVQDFKPDLIIVSQGGTFDNALPLLGQWLQSLNKPLYVICQFMKEFDYLNEFRRTFFIDFFQYAESVWFVSKRNKEVAERALAKEIGNGIIINNPIKVKYTTDKYPSTDIYNLAAVARLDVEIKGYDILIATFAEPQWKDRNYKVNIYGSGPHEEYIKLLIKYYRLEDRIELKGFVKDIVSLWETNHLMIMTSRGEGTPLSLLEANYCKRAAVVTDVGGNADIIEEGYNGFVAEAPVIYCFSTAMERAWEHRDKWQEMGLNAKKKIDSLYNIDAVEEAVQRLKL